MNNSEKVKDILAKAGSSIPILETKKIFGLIPRNHTACWLWIEDCDDHWSLTLANGPTTHKPLLSGPALGADIDKETGGRKIGPGNLTGAWKSALSMWPIRNEVEANQVFELISSKISEAHRYYCGSA